MQLSCAPSPQGDLVLTASLPVLRETNVRTCQGSKVAPWSHACIFKNDVILQESREFVGVLGMDVNPQLMDLRIREHSVSVCVCVCVCERERERESTA